MAGKCPFYFIVCSAIVTIMALIILIMGLVVVVSHKGDPRELVHVPAMPTRRPPMRGPFQRNFKRADYAPPTPTAASTSTTLNDSRFGIIEMKKWEEPKVGSNPFQNVLVERYHNMY